MISIAVFVVLLLVIYINHVLQLKKEAKLLAPLGEAIIVDGQAPYVLCPHFMTGLEALYWAQKYPDEVSAIIGLDMAVPQYFENMKISIPMLKLTGLVAQLGVTRLIPGISESDATKHGSLTDEEKEIYRAIFFSRTQTKTMIHENIAVKDNAKMDSVQYIDLDCPHYIHDYEYNVISQKIIEFLRGNYEI